MSAEIFTQHAKCWWLKIITCILYNTDDPGSDFNINASSSIPLDKNSIHFFYFLYTIFDLITTLLA